MWRKNPRKWKNWAALCSKPSLSDECDNRKGQKYLRRIFGNSENASIYVHYFNHGLNKCTYNIHRLDLFKMLIPTEAYWCLKRRFHLNHYCLPPQQVFKCSNIISASQGSGGFWIRLQKQYIRTRPNYQTIKIILQISYQFCKKFLKSCYIKCDDKPWKIWQGVG